MNINFKSQYLLDFGLKFFQNNLFILFPFLIFLLKILLIHFQNSIEHISFSLFLFHFFH